MKPVLKFEDGKIIPEEKVRTEKACHSNIRKKVLDIVKDFEEGNFICHKWRITFEDGQALYKKLQE